MSFAELWESLLPVGRDGTTGGYRRFAWTGEDAACRGWFIKAAAERKLRAHPDRNGNLWAWWDPPRTGPVPGPRAQPVPGLRAQPPPASGPRQAARARPGGGAIVTGSHLDSVPDGGAFDGPLGVASGFAAIDLLRERGFGPARPIAVAAFCEEEGARFGVACLGSRLLTGAIDPGAARALRDGDGITLAEAMAASGYDPDDIGPDQGLLGGISAFVELHIEQGRGLADLGAAVGIAEAIWPHGRWRLDFAGRADHAGTTKLVDRSDPMLPFAATVLSARQTAASHRALATLGKVIALPGAANAVCSSVSAWLDARAAYPALLDAAVAEIMLVAERVSDEHRVQLTVRQESFTPRVEFDAGLRDRLAGALAGSRASGDRPDTPTVPVLATGAGHDAGVLAAQVPTAMLFVRNPTGVSHSPAEHAEAADCEAGAQALATVLADLASTPATTPLPAGDGAGQ